MYQHLDGRSILITGGTGSFGQAAIDRILKFSDPRRFAILSRDEFKQHEMQQRHFQEPRLRYFLGDIRDLDRLRRAFEGVEIVIHAAALKQVEMAEYNPFEYVKTNVLGTQNVVDAAIDTGVDQVIALSSDKACRPNNVYGATKLCADKLLLAGNSYSGESGPKFSVVRFGNIAGTRGSVLPVFQQLAPSGTLPITDKRMTRFWITLTESVEFLVETMAIASAAELHVPVLPSVRIVDIAKAVCPSCELHEIGLRPGEKLHEQIVDEADNPVLSSVGDRFVIASAALDNNNYLGPTADADIEGLSHSYRSDTNDQWISVDQIRNSINETTEVS